MTLAEIFCNIYANDTSNYKEVSFELLQHVTLMQHVVTHGLRIEFIDASIAELDAFNNTCEVL